jgi:hypothetical protein
VPSSGYDTGRDGQKADSQRSVIGILNRKCRTKTTHFLLFSATGLISAEAPPSRNS